MSLKDLKKEHLQSERIFLSEIFYRNRKRNYDDLLDDMKLNESLKYYKKINNAFPQFWVFNQNLFNFVEAASNFAMLMIDQISFSEYYDRFLHYFYYFEFSMVEFEILYFEHYNTSREDDISKKSREAQAHVLNDYFGANLLINRYEISKAAKTYLETKFKTVCNEIKNVYSNFQNPHNGPVYEFRSEISAVCHYRKHAVRDQIEKSFPQKDVKQYIEEAHEVIYDPNSVKLDQLFQLGNKKVILTKDNKYIKSYFW